MEWYRLVSEITQWEKTPAFVRGHTLRFRNLRVYGFFVPYSSNPSLFLYAGFCILKHCKKKKRQEKWKQHHGRVRISIRDRYVSICNVSIIQMVSFLRENDFFFKSLVRRKHKSLAFVTTLIDTLKRHCFDCRLLAKAGKFNSGNQVKPFQNV